MNRSYKEQLEEEFKNLSSDELRQKSRSGTDTQRNIAAQILAARQDQTEESHHKESIFETRKSNRLATVAIVISVLSVLISILALLLSLMNHWRQWLIDLLR